MISSKISRRYAKALLSLGIEDGNYETYGRDLQEFTGFCSENEEFFQVISSRIFSVEDRKKVLENVLRKGELSNVINNFLRLLLDRNRISAMSGINEYYARLTDEISNITRAQVTTARPLDKDALDKLRAALGHITSKEVKMEISEDEDLIGGLMVKLGDLVLDGSVRAQLEGLKESIRRGGDN